MSCSSSITVVDPVDPGKQDAHTRNALTECRCPGDCERRRPLLSGQLGFTKLLSPGCATAEEWLLFAARAVTLPVEAVHGGTAIRALPT